MIYKYLNLRMLLAMLLVISSFSLSGQATAEAGQKLFKTNCAKCHSKNMKSKSTGPPLAGAQEIWGDDVALYAWIRNSQAMIASGHPRAVEIWNEYKPTVMNTFTELTDDEIGSILMYVNGVTDGSYNPGGGSVVAVDEGVSTTKSNSWIYWLLLGVLGLLALVLMRIIGNLNVIAGAKEGKEIEPQSLWNQLTSKGIIGMLIFGLVVFAGYTTVNNATNLGRQQGYAPEQPIKFSHETHAGINKIDCQYCHDGARRSKHSVIPAANTCMNCHKAIVNGSEYGTAELTKIYASIGYDPNTQKYIEGYEDMNIDEAKEIYEKWIGDQYLETTEKAELDSEGTALIAEEWKGIVSSLTNEFKKDKLYGPIEWVRIHNLPDHVYFNHAQHVTVGQVECQTCHGKVEEMAVVQQHSPLSMGWCINCHRQTDVKFNDNEYYSSYAKYHEELQSGDRESVKVADIGGLECQKCHY